MQTELSAKCWVPLLETNHPCNGHASRCPRDIFSSGPHSFAHRNPFPSPITSRDPAIACRFRALPHDSIRPELHTPVTRAYCGRSWSGSFGAYREGTRALLMDRLRHAFAGRCALRIGRGFSHGSSHLTSRRARSRCGLGDRLRLSAHTARPVRVADLPGSPATAASPCHWVAGAIGPDQLGPHELRWLWRVRIDGPHRLRWWRSGTGLHDVRERWRNANGPCTGWLFPTDGDRLVRPTELLRWHAARLDAVAGSDRGATGFWQTDYRD